MEEENFKPFFTHGDVNEENKYAKRMMNVLHLEATRDYLDIARQHTSKLIKIATQTQKNITQMDTPPEQYFSQF